MSGVQTFVCCSKYYQNDFRACQCQFGFAFDFLQFAWVRSLKMFTICAICPADHLKAKKNWVAEAVSSLFTILCFLLYLKFGPMNFLKTGRRKDRNMFNNQTNLKIFHQRKRNKSCSKDPYFLCRKTLHNGIEVR